MKMIVVIGRMSPGKVYSYHSPGYVNTVKEAYPSADFRAFLVQQTSCSPGDDIDVAGAEEIQLN